MEYGLYASFIPVILAALFGSCQHLSSGPSAITALLVAAVLTSRGLAEGSPDYIALAITLGILCGLVRFTVGVFRLASVVNLLSHPVILGFTNAAALIIASTQISSLLGIPKIQGGHFLKNLIGTFSHLSDAHLPTTLFGLGSVVAILLFKKLSPRLPSVIIIIIVTTLISAYSGFADSSTPPVSSGGDIHAATTFVPITDRVVADIPPGPPAFKWPRWTLDLVFDLLPAACLVTLIGFMEIISISKAVSAQTREPINMNQEMIGQGIMNIVGGFFQCYPVSGSFSRSALNLFSGGKTGLSSVFTGLLVGGLLVALGWYNFLYALPKAVLAAAIVVAVLGFLTPRGLLKIWRIGKDEGVVALATFASSLYFAPKIYYGVVVGAILSFVFLLGKKMRARGGMTILQTDLPPPAVEARIAAGTVVLPISQPLYFTTVQAFEKSVLAVLGRDEKIDLLIFAAEGLTAVDASGEKSLGEQIGACRSRGISVRMAGVADSVKGVLTKSGLLEEIGAENFVSSPAAAIRNATVRGF